MSTTNPVFLEKRRNDLFTQALAPLLPFLPVRYVGNPQNHTQKQHELGKPSCPIFLISHVYRQRAKPPPALDQLRPCPHTTPGKLKGQPSPFILLCSSRKHPAGMSTCYTFRVRVRNIASAWPLYSCWRSSGKAACLYKSPV